METALAVAVLGLAARMSTPPDFVAYPCGAAATDSTRRNPRLTAWLRVGSDGSSISPRMRSRRQSPCSDCPKFPVTA